MSVNYPTQSAPIPLRPLNRTRRRSSSLSAIYNSSPEPDHNSFSQQRTDRKNTKRSRVTRNPPSPLKHSQHTEVFPPRNEPERVTESPFSPLASFNPPPPPAPSGSTFTSSAFDFSLPSTSSLSTPGPRIPRNRTTSSPSSTLQPFTTNPIQQPPSTAYQTNFADSSFSSFTYSSSSAPPSPPSVATSPPSPPIFKFLSNSSASSSSHSQDSNRILALSEPEFSLGQDDEEAEILEVEGMNCDNEVNGEGEDELQEAERLYHVAFEQLRRTTREDEESFVERMRRWEETEQSSSMNESSDGRIPNKSGEEEEEDSQEADDEEDEDELEFKVDVELDLGKPIRKVTELELDDLTRRMKSGACELEDYTLVRQVQAQSTTRGAVVS